MSRKTVNAICATFPGASVSDPWGGGHDAWKVGGKLFATMGAILEGVSVKTDSIETAQMLIEAAVGKRAPYFHRSWIHISWDMEEHELAARLAISYNLIRTTLPKKTQAALPPLLPANGGGP
jgi:predicted DNA-binding protein (MmcQ/YjbR family)